MSNVITKKFYETCDDEETFNQIKRDEIGKEFNLLRSSYFSSLEEAIKFAICYKIYAIVEYEVTIDFDQLDYNSLFQMFIEDACTGDVVERFSHYDLLPKSLVGKYTNIYKIEDLKPLILWVQVS